ncbi:dienelactone hydrolase family protein [Rhodococcus gannanensis]|uniref:Dienelactone hydrolase family protein n=1 Tax=Rhodococcus gannanensis TaxID=1960308 RepID=A0ABW4P2P3_9NOCA
MNGVDTETVVVGELTAHLARPVDWTVGNGAMLVLPMITGIDSQVRGFAADIAAAGMTALVWDPWHGPTADDTPRPRLFELMAGLDDDACLAEMDALLAYLRDELGFERIGVVGYCLGGRFALLLGARYPLLRNVIAYHPSIWEPAAANHTRDAVTEAATIGAPVMVLHAGNDDILSAHTLGALRGALEARESGATIVHVYPGAEHGFSSPVRHGNPVNKAASALSWPQALAFAASTLAP